MKTCKTKTAAERYESCRKLCILTSVVIIIMFVFIIYDRLTGYEVNGAMVTLMCANAAILFSNMDRLKKEKEAKELEAKNEN